MNQEENNNTDNTAKPVSTSKEASNKAMEAIKVGWSTFKERPWLSIGLVILMYAISMVISGPMGMGTSIYMDVTQNIVSQLVSAFAAMVVLYIFFNIYDKKEVDWRKPLTSWKMFINYVVANILTTIAIIAGLILLIVPGVIIMIRLSFVSQLVVDKAMGPVEAIKKSWEITKGNMTYIISLAILTLGVALLGMLALMVGLLVAIPVAMYAYIHAYRTLLKANE